jgi:RNA polymerase sigma-70 factor (ECF subfamily)
MDFTALDPIYRKFHRTAFLQALKILRDDELALDMVQEAFVRVLRHHDQLGEKKDPAGWIRRIVTNLCVDELRKRRTANHVDGESLGEVPAPVNAELSPLYACETQELRTLLREGLSTLSDDHRELFLMRETEGMSYAEMAEEVDVPAGTVMSRLFHARKKLQSHLRRGLMYGPASRRVPTRPPVQASRASRAVREPEALQTSW